MKTLLKPNGLTTCCSAYSTFSMEDGAEYCKGCFNEVQGYLANENGEPTGPSTKISLT